MLKVGQVSGPMKTVPSFSTRQLAPVSSRSEVIDELATARFCTQNVKKVERVGWSEVGERVSPAAERMELATCPSVTC